MKKNEVDFDCLLTIQKEMLAESKRTSLLTVWLIFLTAATMLVSVIAAV